MRFPSSLALILANNGSALAPIRDIRGNLLWRDLIKGQRFLKTASLHSTDDNRQAGMDEACLGYASAGALISDLVSYEARQSFIAQGKMFFILIWLN